VLINGVPTTFLCRSEPHPALQSCEHDSSYSPCDLSMPKEQQLNECSTRAKQ
jgi:hypothetical protein